MSRAKRWCYTLNNWTAEEYEAIKTWEAVYHVVGKETGEAGTPHLQGYIIFDAAKRLTQVRHLSPRTHWEVSRGTPEQASTYCKKDGDYFETGTCPEAGGKRPFEEVVADYRRDPYAFAESSPCEYVRHGKRLEWAFPPKPPGRYPVRAIWLHGAPGVGKSLAADRKFPDAFRKPDGIWWDGYEGETEVIMDDVETGDIPYTYLLRWLDPYAVRVPVKGGFRPLRATRFVITSNHSPLSVFGHAVNIQALERRCEVVLVRDQEHAESELDKLAR